MAWYDKKRPMPDIKSVSPWPETPPLTVVPGSVGSTDKGANEGTSTGTPTLVSGSAVDIEPNVVGANGNVATVPGGSAVVGTRPSQGVVEDSPYSSLVPQSQDAFSQSSLNSGNTQFPHESGSSVEVDNPANNSNGKVSGTVDDSGVVVGVPNGGQTVPNGGQTASDSQWKGWEGKDREQYRVHKSYYAIRQSSGGWSDQALRDAIEKLRLTIERDETMPVGTYRAAELFTSRAILAACEDELSRRLNVADKGGRADVSSADTKSESGLSLEPATSAKDAITAPDTNSNEGTNSGPVDTKKNEKSIGYSAVNAERAGLDDGVNYGTKDSGKIATSMQNLTDNYVKAVTSLLDESGELPIPELSNLNYKTLADYIEKRDKDTADTRAKREKARKSKRVISSVADILSAAVNLWGTTRGSKSLKLGSARKGVEDRAAADIAADAKAGSARQSADARDLLAAAKRDEYANNRNFKIWQERLKSSQGELKRNLDLLTKTYEAKYKQLEAEAKAQDAKSMQEQKAKDAEHLRRVAGEESRKTKQTTGGTHGRKKSKKR